MTNTNKNRLLIACFFIALFLCYKFAISNTVTLKNQYSILQQEQLLYANASKQLSLLKQKQKYYNKLLQKYQLGGSSLQNNLLKTINTFAENNTIKVVNFLEPHSYNPKDSKDDLVVKTYQFTLEGHYNAILKLVHKLEQDTKFGEISSLHFQKKKNYRTGRYYLQAKVLLKSFG